MNIGQIKKTFGFNPKEIHGYLSHRIAGADDRKNGYEGYLKVQVGILPHEHQVDHLPNYSHISAPYGRARGRHYFIYFMKPGEEIEPEVEEKIEENPPEFEDDIEPEEDEELEAVEPEEVTDEEEVDEEISEEI